MDATLHIFKCEYNPMRPCPLNDTKGACTAAKVELEVAPHGWLRCMTRAKVEYEQSQSTPLCESGDK